MARSSVRCLPFLVDCIKHVIRYVQGLCTAFVNRNRPTEAEADVEVSVDVSNSDEPKHTRGRHILYFTKDSQSSLPFRSLGNILSVMESQIFGIVYIPE